MAAGVLTNGGRRVRVLGRLAHVAKVAKLGRLAQLGRLAAAHGERECTCTEALAELQAIVDRDVEAPARIVAHVEHCLACQAELARYRRLLRLLRQLRSSEVRVPSSAVTDVLSSLEQAAGRRAVRSLLTGRRLAYAAAVAGGIAAGAALVLAARRGEHAGFTRPA